MRIGEIVLRLRKYKDRISYITDDGVIVPFFNDLIAGAAELDLAIRNTLRSDAMFVIPLLDDAEPNQMDTAVIQKITERFGVVVALRNDASQMQKTGIVAFDKLHDIRSGLFKTLIGWEPEESASMVYYRGGRNITINNAYMFYQFEFEFYSRLRPEKIVSVDPITKIEQQSFVYGIEGSGHDYDQTAYNWNTIYANIIPADDPRVPYTENLPVDDNFPNVKLPENTAIYLNMRDHPSRGAFQGSFNSEFNLYTDD